MFDDDRVEFSFPFNRMMVDTWFKWIEDGGRTEIDKAVPVGPLISEVHMAIFADTGLSLTFKVDRGGIALRTHRLKRSNDDGADE